MRCRKAHDNVNIDGDILEEQIPIKTTMSDTKTLLVWMMDMKPPEE